MACSIHFYCSMFFFSFFTVLEHGPTRRFTWVCFSATRPLRPIYHRKRYTLSIVKCHREAHFPGRKISGEMFFFFHFFPRTPDRCAVVPVSQKDPNGVPFHSPVRIFKSTARPGRGDFFPGRPRLVLIIYIVYGVCAFPGKRHGNVVAPGPGAAKT